MVIEASKSDVERLKKVSEGEINNLKEYIALLNGIIDTLEQDIITTRLKSMVFQKTGQNENYAHLLERITETTTRIETCRKCVEDCKTDLGRKEDRIREYNHVLGLR